MEGRGHVHGYAYEVIAAARFIDAPRTPGNGGRAVQITQGSDSLVFGQKLPAGPHRRTVEADILVFKSDGHKIAIDTKNYKNPFPADPDFRSELKGVKEAIRQGEVHEFHFVVRGGMSPAAKLAIERADAELRAEMHAAVESANPTLTEYQARDVDLSTPVICWHEELG